mmetsp:Transcript_29760/g.48437  ORF Transcript_29760/g.48437 Transcript_29760/m.48437 type:complete len:87 (-) Transcript_29760:399-659(-)
MPDVTGKERLKKGEGKKNTASPEENTSTKVVDNVCLLEFLTSCCAQKSTSDAMLGGVFHVCFRHKNAFHVWQGKLILSTKGMIIIF